MQYGRLLDGTSDFKIITIDVSLVIYTLSKNFTSLIL